MDVRLVTAAEHEAAGSVVVAAYTALPGAHLSGGYAALLADVARRSEEADVLVAVPSAGAAEPAGVLGCVTFVPGPESAWAELLEDGEAGIRMLAVRPDAQRHGAGRALVEACVGRALELGRRAVMLHTTPWMTAAHRLYENVGFTRFPDRDWTPEPEVPLLSYRLDLVLDEGTAR